MEFSGNTSGKVVERDSKCPLLHVEKSFLSVFLSIFFSFFVGKRTVDVRKHRVAIRGAAHRISHGESTVILFRLRKINLLSSTSVVGNCSSTLYICLSSELEIYFFPRVLLIDEFYLGRLRPPQSTLSFGSHHLWYVKKYNNPAKIHVAVFVDCILLLVSQEPMVESYTILHSIDLQHNIWIADSVSHSSSLKSLACFTHDDRQSMTKSVLFTERNT